MARTSIYDRISEKRLADEARAREEAERVANAPPLVIEPEPVEPVPLQLACNELKLAGLNLVLPQEAALRDIDITLDRNGLPVTLSAKRRAAPDGLTLEHSATLYADNLRRLYPDLAIVRQADYLLAGHQAIALDYVFTQGQITRHGRAVSSIIAQPSGGERHWLSISTLIDPNKSALADWLIDFDAMLASIATY